MKTLTRLIAVVIVLSSLNATAGRIPVGIAEYEFLYDRLERERAMTLDLLDRQIGPYLFEQIQITDNPYAWLTEFPDESINLFGIGNERLTARKNNATVGFEAMRGGVVAQPKPWLSIYGHLMLDEQLAVDPDYPGKTWRGLAGDVEQMFISVNTGGFDGIFGRFAAYWGERRSLLLAPTQALDGMSIGYRFGRLKLTYLLTRLDGLSPEQDSVAEFENRFLVGHRLDIHAADWLDIGFFETAIFGGPGRTVELSYLNPLMFFHAFQLNEKVDDNTILGVDASIHPTKNVRLYSQLVVDDVQVDDKQQTDKEPNQLAILAGGYAADIVAGFDLRVEFSRVNNWTFNQPLERNRYLFNGKPLGAALGNDYDQIRLTSFWWPSNSLLFSFDARLLRRGEGQIDAAWTAPWLDINGDYSEDFPSGTVETTRRFALGGRGMVWSHLFVSVDAGVELVQNFGHVDGDDRTLPFANLHISLLGGRSIRIAE